MKELFTVNSIEDIKAFAKENGIDGRLGYTIHTGVSFYSKRNLASKVFKKRVETHYFQGYKEIRRVYISSQGGGTPHIHIEYNY